MAWQPEASEIGEVGDASHGGADVATRPERAGVQPHGEVGAPRAAVGQRDVTRVAANGSGRSRIRLQGGGARSGAAAVSTWPRASTSRAPATMTRIAPTSTGTNRTISNAVDPPSVVRWRRRRSIVMVAPRTARQAPRPGRGRRRSERAENFLGPARDRNCCDRGAPRRADIGDAEAGAKMVEVTLGGLVDRRKRSRRTLPQRLVLGGQRPKRCARRGRARRTAA